MKSLYILFCFLLGIFIHIFLSIDGFENKLESENNYYCVANNKSTNCNNNYANNFCKNLCKGADPNNKCKLASFLEPTCKITGDPDTEDCCSKKKKEPGVCPGSYFPLNASSTSSTTNGTPYTQYIMKYSRVAPTDKCITRANKNATPGTVNTNNKSEQSVYFIVPDN